MSSSSSPALLLEVPDSGAGLMSAALIVLAALPCVVLMYFGVLAGSTLWALLILSGSLSCAGVALWQSGYWHASRRLQAITWQQQGDWLLRFADGRVLTAQLAIDSWVTPWLFCLRFNTASKHRPAVMVWRGQLSGANWQLWRTRLHLQGAARVTPVERPVV